MHRFLAQEVLCFCVHVVVYSLLKPDKSYLIRKPFALVIGNQFDGFGRP